MNTDELETLEALAQETEAALDDWETLRRMTEDDDDDDTAILDPDA